MEIQIKLISSEDAEDVQRLSKQLGYSLSVEEIENNIREVTTRKDHVAFVALGNAKLVGWVHVFKAVLLESKPFIEIGGLVVDENYRNKGVGKKLVEKIKEWSVEKGILDIRVRSNVKRNEAHGFYTNIGFSEIKEQKVFQMKL